MRLILSFLALLVMLLLTACTPTGTCDHCGKENVEVRAVAFHTSSANLCQDCYALFELGLATQEH